MSNRSPSNDPIQWFFHASLLVLFGVIALSVAVQLLQSIWMWVVGLALSVVAIIIAVVVWRVRSRPW